MIKNADANTSFYYFVNMKRIETNKNMRFRTNFLYICISVETTTVLCLLLTRV